MGTLYAPRMRSIPKSFIREILKVTEDPNVISFAGGLPNPRFFPVEAIAKATSDVLSGVDTSALQYSTTEGYRPLRESIAQRYKQKKGLAVSADEILITNGSQQALDLIGKVFIGPIRTNTKKVIISGIGVFSPYTRVGIRVWDIHRPIISTRWVEGSNSIYRQLGFQNREASAPHWTMPGIVWIRDERQGNVRVRRKRQQGIIKKDNIATRP